MEECKENEKDNRNWVSPSVDHKSFVQKPPLFAESDLSLSSNYREASVQLTLPVMFFFSGHNHVMSEVFLALTRQELYGDILV